MTEIAVLKPSSSQTQAHHHPFQLLLILSDGLFIISVPGWPTLSHCSRGTARGHTTQSWLPLRGAAPPI